MRKSSLFACLVVSFLWLSVAATPAAAQYFGRNKVQYDKFDFRSFRTDHFEFYFYPEEKLAVEDAARMGERWYRRHTRTFLREFHERKPIIFYANDADFHQTNAIGGSIGEGTGGVTESLKERVIMPLTGIYQETDHVLGHELVHSFQYDIGLSRQDSTQFALQLLPLWLIEGMAEYFSVGRYDAHTAMWMRDAALRDDLPTIEQITRSMRYFPYRYGQAYLAYVGGKYGDAAVANLFKLGGLAGLDSAFVYALGITADSLSNEWIQTVKDNYLPLTENRTPADSAGRKVLAEDLHSGSMNLAPALSPDGQYVAYLSEQDLFNINLFIADSQTGRSVRKLRATNTNPHFDNIRFINSAGSWSPDGKKFAFITFAQGDNEISIWNLDTGDLERRIAVEGVSAMSNPAWSPDGKTIAFSGIDGGISDLYLFNVVTGEVRQITDDRFADLQPAWSPDGTTVAVVTDRGPNGTNFETLEYAKTRIALVNIFTGDMEFVFPFEHSKHINPQFSPDGRSLFFISDQDGFSDIYRYALDTKETYRITSLQTGVSGITGLSPALTVAGQSGRMMFSVFSGGNYSVFSLEAEETVGEPIAEAAERLGDERIEGFAKASILPPFRAVDEGLVGNYLNDPLTGLPDKEQIDTKEYKSRLKLDYVAPPTVGVSAGGLYGAGFAGGVGFFFSDMLGNKNLGVIAQANGTFKDIGGQVTYMDRGRRFNFGGALGHIPVLFGGTALGSSPEGFLQVNEIRQRIFIDQIVGIGAYPFTSTRRLEVNAGFTRYGYDYEVITYTYAPGGIARDKGSLPAPDPIYFFHSAAAYVGDFANFGFTSPVQGGRYRFEVAPRFGTVNYVTALADYRRYFFKNPVTIAFRGLHIGNYGAPTVGASNFANFGQEYLGYSYYPGFIRGYSFNSIDSNRECGSPEQFILADNGELVCNVVALLQGTRIAMASAEIRMPLFGTEALGLINFPYLPTELTVFTDAGLAWNEGDNPFELLEFERRPTKRVPVVSVGASARFNLLGYMVFEVFYAHPFQRPDKGGHFGVQLLPGW